MINELAKMCMDAHGDKLPNDYNYAFIVESLKAIADHGDKARECIIVI